MGCQILTDRINKPACGIKGATSEHANTSQAVDITDACDVDVGERVVLTYASNKHKKLVVKVGIESVNGEDFRCWDVSNVRKRNYNLLRGFCEMAGRIGLRPVILGNYIIEKSP